MGCGSSKKAVAPTVARVSKDPAATLRSESTMLVHRVEDLKIRPGQFIQRLTEPFTSRYRLIDELGSGNFGKVYKVEHRTTRDIRAVKEIDKRRADTLGGSHSQFIAEVEILSRLDHPNILKIFEMYEDRSRFYIVSELCEGGELFEYITSRKQLSEPMAASIMRQVLSAVAYCHEHSIVHRDLKPENLLLDTEPTENSPIRIKLIDFGTSCLYSKHTRLSKKLGTAYYIAPEVLNRSYNEKCDVWSCGVILYIMLCGYPPFGGTTDEEILRRVKTGKFSFAHENWHSITESAKHLIRKMLTFDPATRPSAEQCLSDPWLQVVSKVESPYPAAIGNSLSLLHSFTRSEKLKQAFFGFLTSQLLTKDAEQQLAEAFRVIDKNGDGKLSREELLEAYRAEMPLDEAQQAVESIMQQVDTDRNGFIDYSEFISACASHKNLLSKKNLQAAFDAFDKDHSGKISAQELRLMLGANSDVSEDVWDDLIRQADRNGDGEIEYDEFLKLMLDGKVLS